jgi:hypothetical protein
VLTNKLSCKLHDRVLNACTRQVFHSLLRLDLNASIKPFALHVRLRWIGRALILEIKCYLVGAVAASVDVLSLVGVACVLAN